MKKVRLLAGNDCRIKLIIQDNSFLNSTNKPEIINGWDDDNEENCFSTTLRDISIILQSMVGQGVIYQLSNELSNELKVVSPKEVWDALEVVMHKYENLTDEEAEEFWENIQHIEGV